MHKILMTIGVVAPGLLLGACAEKANPPATSAVSSVCIADNTKPYVGGYPKCAAQMEADAEFVATFDKAGVPHPDAARKVMALGWYYLSKGDYDTAMRRFNQAWLLDPTSPAVPWGYAIVAWSRDQDLAASRKFFAEARRGLPENSGLDADEGRVLCDAGQKPAAMELLDRALVLDPKNAAAAQTRKTCQVETSV